MDQAIVDILKPVGEIFKKQGYHRTGLEVVLQAFMASVAMNSDSEGNLFDTVHIDAGKPLDKATGAIHMVSVIALGDPKIPDNYYIVGMRTTVEQATSENGVELCPPMLPLKDFLARVGDQGLPEFFDSLPRFDRAAYAKVKPAGPQHG